MTRNDATQRQVEAADPLRSTWLSANAGSGKTRVLTDRVARLLLGGTRPENILCLTYTKAAASEMQNRLFARLGDWAMMPEPDLRKALHELGDETALSSEDLAQARRLFASAIEAPGGLKIQTIHSFCAGVLRRFPLEAGVSPQFQEMEDRAAELLRAEVLDEMASGGQAPAVTAFAKYYTGAEVDGLLSALTQRKTTFLAEPPDLDHVFDLTPGATEQDAVTIAFTGGEADLTHEMVEAAKGASKSYQDTAVVLKALCVSAPDLAMLDAVRPHLLYADKSSKSRNWPQSRHTKAVDAFAPIIEEIHAWMDRTAEAFEYLNRIAARDRTQALFTFARPFVTAYEEKKTQRAALDFDDLILRAKALLKDPAVAQWVLFRLDGGVDHVLVDEAQDTSPDQWEIVRLLTQEFSTGEGAHPDRERTVFVVGDKKQSIYSFQGADPEGFDRMRDHFEQELQNVSKSLQNSELLYSFRSSSAVLELVDQVFQRDMAEGLGDRIEHLAFKRDMPGRVDLWPVIEPVAGPEDREWDDPLDQKGETNHKVLLARRIAADIKRMIDTETLPVQTDEGWSDRPITPGDFLILVQRRSDLFAEIIAACKSAGLDIAGADRLKLGGELAVKDIAALLRFLALQEDDLSLAAALRSPLFGWSERDLYQLAQPRKKGQSLWEALRRSGQHPDTLKILTDLRNVSDFLRPYDLINRLLITHDGRRRLLSRLGHEAEDGIDALLSQALGYEQAQVPSLTGFLSWLQTEDVTVKRQMDAAGDRIRVMTVHGAKGLEAPIVILPDTAKRKRELRGDLLTAGDSVFWKPKSEEMPTVLADIRDEMLEAQDRERRRLLYVALTRAENWLIVAAAGDVGVGSESWHGTVDAALDHLDTVEVDTGFGAVRRFSRMTWATGKTVNQKNADPSPLAETTFAQVLPDLPTELKPLSPSDLGGAKILYAETDPDAAGVALLWGTVLHGLLERLPDIPAAQRAQVAQQFVENHPDRGLLPDPQAVAEEALSLLNSQPLSWIFESGLAEVPITAELPCLNGRQIFGVIDRLIVNPTEVIVVDYKSNRLVPDHPEHTPDGLLRQMAVYREALRLVFPDKSIRAVILWTRTGTLTNLPDPLLDAALNRVSDLDASSVRP